MAISVDPAALRLDELGALRCGRHLQVKRQERGETERHRDAGNTGGPAELVEDLAEDGAADETAVEIAGEIDPACRAAVDGRRLADKAGRRRLREEGTDADERQTAKGGRTARRGH